MESINRPELVKEHNLNLVRKALFQARHATRQQLSTLTSISNVTLGTLLGRLVETGEALESDTVQPVSGRPARVYSYNPRWRTGLLVFSTYENRQNCLHSVIIDLYGDTVWEEHRPVGSMDHEETLAFFYRLFRLGGTVRAVGLGLPGIGFGEYLYKDKGWDMERLSLTALEELRGQTGIPFLVENDVNLAALGYARREQVGAAETLVYLYLMKDSFGGAGVYLNGGLHLGKDRFAGERLLLSNGKNWSQMKEEPADVLLDGLTDTVLPYLTVLAPDRLVIASDYIKDGHLLALEARTGVLLDGHCPRFSLTGDFRRDYQEGLKQLVLKQLT